MKFSTELSSPKKLAVYLSLFSATFFLLMLLVADFSLIKDQLFFWFCFYLLLLICFFFFFSFILTRFVARKIKPIYDTINSIKISEEEIFQSLDNENTLSEINEKVVNWVKTKTQEITLLKANEKYRKEFLGNVSHELKTPIFNIQGYITTLIDGGLEDNEINELYLKKAEKNINRLISIVNDLETISKLEVGELKLHCENFNVIPLIQEVFENHEIRAGQNNVQLSLIRKHKGNISVFADRKRIFDVLSNLVINSIIYSKKNGKTIVDVSDSGDVVKIEVSDDGIGIPEEYQQRVFERFFRVDKSRSAQQGGTGLGLAIVKHIIEGHGQTIELMSTPGEGSTFIFTLQKAI